VTEGRGAYAPDPADDARDRPLDDCTPGPLALALARATSRRVEANAPASRILRGAFHPHQPAFASDLGPAAAENMRSIASIPMTVNGSSAPGHTTRRSPGLRRPRSTGLSALSHEEGLSAVIERGAWLDPPAGGPAHPPLAGDGRLSCRLAGSVRAAVGSSICAHIGGP